VARTQGVTAARAGVLSPRPVTISVAANAKPR